MKHLLMFMLTILLAVYGALGQEDASVPRLTNKDIVSMVKAGVSPEVIISKIKISRCNFDTDPTVLAELKQNGVSNETLKAMIEAPYGLPKQELIEKPSVAPSPSPLVAISSLTTADCDKWSIKGVRLGMTLKEVKAEHKSLGHGRNWFRPEDKRKGWYVWTESRWNGLYNYVLPERDEPDATIISVTAVLDVKQDASPVIDALIERWGQPLSREVAVDKVRYFNVFGAPEGQFDWLATTWEDRKCDIMVTVFDKTKLSPGPYRMKFKTVTVSFDSISHLVVQKEKELEKARKVVRP
jgi:hypothetical protein